MQVMMTAGPGLAQLFNGYDSGYVSVMVADSDFIDYFNIGSARLGAFSSSIVWGGVGFSMFYIAPAIPHRFGRRWGFIACSCFIIVGVIMQVATGPYYGVLVVGRILWYVFDRAWKLTKLSVVSELGWNLLRYLHTCRNACLKTPEEQQLQWLLKAGIS